MLKLLSLYNHFQIVLLLLIKYQDLKINVTLLLQQTYSIQFHYTFRVNECITPSLLLEATIPLCCDFRRRRSRAKGRRNKKQEEEQEEEHQHQQ